MDDTSVTVSWNEVPDFSIDYYTVVYSQVSEGGGRENGEMRFSSPATSGVITDLDPTAIYQFHVFALCYCHSRRHNTGRKGEHFCIYKTS